MSFVCLFIYFLLLSLSPYLAPFSPSVFALVPTFMYRLALVLPVAEHNVSNGHFRVQHGIYSQILYTF